MYIGIDLGTTNSAVAGYNKSKVKLYKTSDGSDTLPSVIYADKRGYRLYGKRAYDQTLLSPENVASGFKRLMGTSTKINLKASAISLTAEECSADILKHLMGQVFTESGIEEITGTIITIPAAFNQMQSEATIQAANLAGIDKVALLQEPIAAAMAAMSSTNNKNGQFLIYDLGGGTFDLALVQSISGAINIIAHEGINMLGGRDFDNAIVNNIVRPWLVENFDLPLDFQKQEKYRRIIRIAHLAAEKTKIELSTKNSEIIFASDDEIRLQDESGNEIYLEVELTRYDVEQLITDEIQKTIDLSRQIIKDNGYSNEDIDRIVFIGGPTKMPYIRNIVPQELGIQADLQIDPMTAVAQGAAIYCESREWDSATTKRKSSRGSHKTTGKLNIKYDYPSRSSDNKTKVRITTVDIVDGYEVQIDSASGWTSGRIAITAKTTIDLQLDEMGDNAFRATVFDNSGKLIKQASTQFIITHTHASSVGIPATQTIAVKVRKDIHNTGNKLIKILEKGTPLPVKGVQRFRAAHTLTAGNKQESLDFEIYQDEGAPEPELNLSIGSFRVKGNDLEAGMKIREGDEIIFHWQMSDSGLLKATVELPTINQSFDTAKFYVAQAGHQDFDLDSGTKLATSILSDAEQELEDVREIIDDSSSDEYQKIEDEIESQRDILDNASEGDTTRAVTEKARHIRQKISKIKHSSKNRGKVLKQEVLRLAEMFDKLNRKNSDSQVVNRFDTNKNNALDCIDRGDIKSIEEAETHLDEMKTINQIELWNNPEFLRAMFKLAVDEIYLATSKSQYKLLLQQGIKAIEDNNNSELRKILFALNDLKVNVAGAEQSMAKLASIMAI